MSAASISERGTPCQDIVLRDLIDSFKDSIDFPRDSISFLTDFI